MIDAFKRIQSKSVVPKREEGIVAIFDVVLASIVAAVENEDVFEFISVDVTLEVFDDTVEDVVVIVVTNEIFDDIAVLVFSAVVDESPRGVVMAVKFWYFSYMLHLIEDPKGN